MLVVRAILEHHILPPPAIPKSTAILGLALAISHLMAIANALAVSTRDFASVLERRLKHMESKKANITKMIEVEPEKVDARLPDRRFRRI
jgi:hypothetical protein